MAFAPAGAKGSPHRLHLMDRMAHSTGLVDRGILEAHFRALVALKVPVVNTTGGDLVVLAASIIEVARTDGMSRTIIMADVAQAIKTGMMANGIMREGVHPDRMAGDSAAPALIARGAMMDSGVLANTPVVMANIGHREMMASGGLASIQAAKDNTAQMDAKLHHNI